jgi:hypothetical protein
MCRTLWDCRCRAARATINNPRAVPCSLHIGWWVEIGPGLAGKGCARVVGTRRAPMGPFAEGSCARRAAPDTFFLLLQKAGPICDRAGEKLLFCPGLGPIWSFVKLMQTGAPWPFCRFFGLLTPFWHPKNNHPMRRHPFPLFSGSAPPGASIT